MTPVSADDQVLTAYRTFWDAVIAAHKATDPQLPALAAVGGEPRAEPGPRKAIAVNKSSRSACAARSATRSERVKVAGATATVEDCYDISAWNPIDLRTGDAIDVTDYSGTGRYHARYTLRRSGASWLVVDQKALGGC